MSNQNNFNNELNQEPTDDRSNPFSAFAKSLPEQSALRLAITNSYRTTEQEALAQLIEHARFSETENQAIWQLSSDLVNKIRNNKNGSGRASIVQDLLQEFSLSSQEGIALMCLAEALLRIPDKTTRDALIRDKVGNGDWKSHISKDSSIFVNATTWGLMLTRKLVTTHSESSLTNSINKIIAKGGAPVIRKGVDVAMRIMGKQFVSGETIEQALSNAKNSEELGFRFSYDMLGEAALTEQDAQRYINDYRQAVHAIGKASNGRGIYEGPGLSIKLSAMHTRYSRSQFDRVIDELYPRVLEIFVLAKQYNIGVNIDAEEADRLEISFDLLERLCFAPELEGWNGIGFVIQAYQKRCPFVIDYLIDLAKRSNHRLMIRLVKGAYWDSEIKRAQVDGLEDYPVYTRKEHTDISYLACAKKLLAAPEQIYPQFASHNARTLASVYQLAGQEYYPGKFEFQCLYGMGEPLYSHVVGQASADRLGIPCRIYAPVGTHETLLAYLVRRLLENGANTSFVNLIADKNVAIEQLLSDPIALVDEAAKKNGAIGLPHLQIPLPSKIYGNRVNSAGIDLSNENHLSKLAATLIKSSTTSWQALPILPQDVEQGQLTEIRNPADHTDLVGYTRETTPEEINQAIENALTNAPNWQQTTPQQRAQALEVAADLMQEKIEVLIGLIVREAGKTFNNAIAEVREAIDFLRFYAQQAKQFDNQTYRALGPVVCISPWNFPLAIFIGQVSAALAAGNTVLAKPAQQTPLIAAQAIEILLQAGIPAGVVQLTPGLGQSVGSALVTDPRIKGVMFTGSTGVAKIIAKNIAPNLDEKGNPIPLIAETGGQNAMFVDSSALTEQVVIDAINSAFDSAGQRCSALRLLCVQEDCADRVINMLKGAMSEYRLGVPTNLAVDIGPVIDAAAKSNIDQHIEQMRANGRKVTQAFRDDLFCANKGTYVVPTLIEIESVAELTKEVFGPVLHVLRYKRQDFSQVMQQIHATGYGLTMGIHSRIEETINQVITESGVGNLYVNRNIVGAVVGVQPFGGEGLSGTGPKAGGALYLMRLLAQRPEDALAKAVAILNPAQFTDEVQQLTHFNQQGAIGILSNWAAQQNKTALKQRCDQLIQQPLVGLAIELTGPTGENNMYHFLARKQVLCLASQPDDLLAQLAIVLVAGSKAMWQDNSENRILYEQLPDQVKTHISLVANWQTDMLTFDLVLYHGDNDSTKQINTLLAERDGPIISLIAQPSGSKYMPIDRIIVERSISTNTAAAGGNASLMTLG